MADRLEPEAPDEALIRRYLAAMARSDLATVVACFAPNGVVVSPTYGEMPVRTFYETLFADTLSADVKVRSIYRATVDQCRWIAHFDYRWQRRSVPQVAVQLIDLFDLKDGLIRELRIVFA